ncbi:unnamed protein product [Rotaria socialis]|uniref:Uncharacterized protein n=1 Tax=Rotaria socialis TaxID=392032 RepID=A0A820SSE9_9BILA|nr:unnamed protein product [Rotaria socialis]
MLFYFQLQLRLPLFDVSSDDNYACLRPLAYSEPDVVLICFNVDCPTSTANIITQWNPEIRQYCVSCPIVLVACKIDLRADPQTSAVLKAKGQKQLSGEDRNQIAVEIKVNAYMECSAKTRQGVQELLAHAARLSLMQTTNPASNRMCFTLKKFNFCLSVSLLKMFFYRNESFYSSYMNSTSLNILIVWHFGSTKVHT